MELTVRCSATDCDLDATTTVRWQATLIPVCDTHTQGRVAEEPVDAAPDEPVDAAPVEDA